MEQSNIYSGLENEVEISKKAKKVYEILLTPILCDKDVPKITIKEGIIITPQHYCGAADEDMSDFSIGFYKIVYKELLSNNNGEMLNENGHYLDKEYMGDTMHSFNSIANVILNDVSKKFRSPIQKWPPELVEYYSKYHCLANFWLIPMWHGRKSAKLSKYDSLDYYLTTVKEHLINDINGYFGEFVSWENFLESHYISRYVLKSSPLLMYVSKDKNSCISEINRINKFWELRANELANRHTDELYEYFDNLGLTKNI